MENTELTLWIIGLVIGLSEIVLRAIPNEKVKGIIGYAVEGLNFISDYFNRKLPW